MGIRMTKHAALGAFVGLSLVVSVTAQAQSSKRTELTKGDLSGTNMEIIVGIVEVPPGAFGVLHTHPGEEAYYVIDGATASLPDGKQINLEPGTAKINVRDVPHGAFKVIGDKALKLLTVHIVDKGKPMTVPVK
jgi:quercetin dioxygenase-like cupin family protein